MASGLRTVAAASEEQPDMVPGEPGWVVTQVAKRAGVTAREARRIINAVHQVVDRVVTDDVTVIAPPLLLGWDNNPVFERFVHMLLDKNWEVPPQRADSTPEDLSALLPLPLPVVERYP